MIDAPAQTNILTSKSQPPLLEQLKSLLSGAVATDIAAGYLFVSGFAELATELSRPQMERIRVLIGRTDRPTLDALAGGLQDARAIAAAGDAGYIPQKTERLESASVAVERIGEGVGRMEQSEKSELAVAALRDMVSSGKLEIKTYPYGMLHAKAYLCWYPQPYPATAIVGSSNLTLSGFLGNTELNVQIGNPADLTALKNWFDDLWKDSVDVTEDVLVELNRSWPIARTTPYEIYLKTLFELYGAEGTPPPAEPQLARAPKLANFQLDAVRRALGMVERHGGCFIGDVVGLGKTYIGAEIVRQLQFGEPRGKNPLIVCPAGLMPMWKRVSEIFGLGAEVVSMSNISPPAGADFDEESGDYIDREWSGGGIDLLETYPERGVVLVDEAHNFRSPGTRRWEALHHYLWSGDHKTVLLSATPQNLGPFDIYHQLRLFLDDVQHGLQIEPLDLQDYFSALTRWYEYKVELDNWQAEMLHWQELKLAERRTKLEPVKPGEPTVPYATIDQVLNPVFVRRRRRDIKEIYGDDVNVAGKQVVFPTPALDNVPYLLDKVYAKAMPLDDLMERLKAHNGARYRALAYLTDKARASGQYKDLERAHNRVAVLVRFLLLKRLESSVAAFRSTLQVLARSNRNFRDALDAGFVPLGKTATSVLSREEFSADDLLDRLHHEEEKRAGQPKRSKLVHPTADFETALWIEDLDADFEILREVLEAIDRVAPADDDKLQTLKQFLERPDIAAGKVLVFSEASATIDYLYEHLNPGGADDSVARITGDNRDSLTGIVRRFAPGANPDGSQSGPEIRILLASDVVSEGQNLQDCNRVLNYDLHWNPVRLIQRFGRVDRIGTVHEEIFLHNMWPDTELDKELDLTARLAKRVQSFHDFIGLDNRLLSPDETLNDQSVFAIYEKGQLPAASEDDLDEVAAYQRGVGLLQQIEEKDPDLFARIQKLPDGIRSARVLPKSPVEGEAYRLFAEVTPAHKQSALFTVREEHNIETPMDPPRAGESVVFLKTGDVVIPYAVDDALAPRRITPTQLLGAVECEESERREPLPPGANARVTAAVASAQRDLEKKLGVLAAPKSHPRSRSYVKKELARLLEANKLTYTDDDKLRIDVLTKVFVLGHFPTYVGEQLNQIRRDGIAGEGLVARLDALRARYRLIPSGVSAASGQPVEVLRIVCSEGLTA